MSHFSLTCPSIRKIKEKKKKRNINNDLAVLPSHDIHQFFNDSHGLKGYGKPSKIPFDLCQSHLKAINIGQDIKQIN